MNKKENQRIMLTKRLLKESLINLLKEKNINKISVSELCKKAGINRSTFYNHYGSQFDVLKEMELDMIEDLNKISKELQKGNWTLKERTSEFCTYLKDNKDFVKLIFSNSDTDSKFASLLIKSAHIQYICKQTFLNEKNQIKHDLMTTFLVNGTYQMVRKWILDDIPITPDEMGELIYNMSIHEWDIYVSYKNNC